MAAQVHWFARDFGQAWQDQEVSRRLVGEQVVLLGDRLRLLRAGCGDVPDAVIDLIDAQGHSLGASTKMDAHQAPGRLHRAFSVLLFDEQDRLLLQRRAATKYHFAGRWTNSCCGHPAPGTNLVERARIRCLHELGLGPQLSVAGSFTYRATDPVSGLVEYELDTVLTGDVGGEPFNPNAQEVDATRCITPEDLRREMASAPEEFTPWLLEALSIALAHRVGAGS